MARQTRRYNGVTESATENRPPAEWSTVAVAQGDLSDVYERAGLKPGLYMLATLGKGEKVG